MNLKYYQQESPFYFTGKTTVLAPQPTGSKKKEEQVKSVFCKVWRDGDRLTSVDMIKKEIEMLMLASLKGEPCPDLIDDLSKVNYSSDLLSSSAVYHILAMNELSRDEVLLEHTLDYTISLVNACLKLHNDAKILHCDVKPENLSWDSTTLTVSLLDFGHAQLEEDAEWYRGTRGYEAPEIVQSEEKR